jgi:hypothetical protein
MPSKTENIGLEFGFYELGIFKLQDNLLNPSRPVIKIKLKSSIQNPRDIIYTEHVSIAEESEDWQV